METSAEDHSLRTANVEPWRKKITEEVFSTEITRLVVEGKNIVLGDYGPAWKLQRKIAHSALRVYGSARGALEEKITEEVCCRGADFGEETSPPPHPPFPRFDNLGSMLLKKNLCHIKTCFRAGFPPPPSNVSGFVPGITNWSLTGL